MPLEPRPKRRTRVAPVEYAPKNPGTNPAERGAALLTVLILVAVIAVMAATALERLRLSTRLTANAVALDQARGLAYAAEALATGRVTDLLRQSPSRVTLDGGWSNRPYTIPLPNGIATARVSDGGNCFNLNSLVTDLDGMYVADPTTVVQFARLARLLNVPGGEAIAAAAADWIDSDDQALGTGAEDSAYTGLATPYRTAGTLMVDSSELRAVTGVTAEAYQKLRPWLCTLPRAARSSININTLTPEQAPLVAMLLPDTLGIGQAAAGLLRRPPGGFSDTQDFWKIFAASGVTADPAAEQQTGITTKWFDLRITVNVAGSDVEERALIDASTLPAQLVSRQWGEAT
ncbi:type II secretion system minor pseudopilin GspK [Sphingomonas radiodurans]|uniref:type II secretion system minor pseudopilin GspK n=1 Tax=Sphingomonas radiodurans TaxID=2890321 RepID=UPI001E4C6BD7|nr:type II secretion system minor pseudopilin GspK [Sphingomonas radiodurans]WBH16293.1 type II secretion system minor pseudopilin GspK [Sphingomonas radiodurans]